MGARILIAASGTGGHLFPALYIARALQKLDAEAEIQFVGSGRPLEEQILGPAGYRRHVVDIVGVNRRGLKGLLEFAGKLPKALLQTWRILSSFRPQVIVGVGGYASVLPVLLGRLRGIPAWIHEAELRPGLANRLLGYIASKASVAFKQAEMPRPSRTVFTGHPLREEILQVPSMIGEGTLITNLLVLGGSQGAEALDRGLPELAPLLRELHLTVLHQSRRSSVEAVQQAYARGVVTATVRPFIEDVAGALRWAHLVVSRSGAGSLMELSVANRPVIFVPFPSKGIQQHSNARVLEAQGKALVVEEGSDFERRLAEALRFLAVPKNFFAMQARPCEQRVLDAAQRIASGVLGLVERQERSSYPGESL